MDESALQLWHGVLFRQRPDLTFESISPRVEQWTGLAPDRALEAVHPADRGKLAADATTFRLRHARTWRVTWIEQRRRAVSGGFEGYWEDVTARVHLEQRLAQAHWRATLGNATQRLVHDFNNLLTGILSLSDAYLARVRPDNPAREGLQLINQNARQAAGIVQQIGGLFREEPGRRAHENLSALAAAAVDMLRRVLPKHSSVKLNQKAEAIAVYVHGAELKQVIVSLALALTPPITVEVSLDQKEARLEVGGAAAEPSLAALAAQGFAERNDASFSSDSKAYTFRFAEADFSEPEGHPHWILLIADDNPDAFHVADLLRHNAYQVVIGREDLKRSLDYRFDAVVHLLEGSSSLLHHGDVVLSAGMTEEAILAKVREALQPIV